MRRSIEAPAKINLLLAVGPERSDGFHELVTVMQTLDLADRMDVVLETRRTGGADVLVEAPGVDGGDTLVTRAVSQLLDHCGRSARVWVAIEKEIPVGAGLGGGSSDAAAALLAVNDMLGSPLGSDELAEVASGIGSDVPFFLLGPGSAAIARGRGELVAPVPAPPPRALLLLNPGMPLSTGRVYDAFDHTSVAPLPETDAEALEQVPARGGPFRNDLALPARALSSELDRLCQALEDAGAAPLVCGSGATVAVHVESEEDRRALEAVARTAAPQGVWIRTARTTRTQALSRNDAST